MTSLARAEAVRAGRAQPIATVRHVHVHDRPLVLVPLTLAGEANAPLAAMVGDDPDKPRLLVVAQPRNRDQRFAFATALAGVIVSYADGFTARVEAVAGDRARDIRVRFADAPQIVVPNPGGVDFARLFGRSTRFRRSYGDYAVDPAVPMLGRWLTFFAERAEYPGSCLLLAATEALALHWATGQSLVEDQNLAALLGWIDPPVGLTGAQAAVLAEDAGTWPPAGPTTDPTFDSTVLAPLIQAGDVPGLEKALTAQLEPTWGLVWRAVDRLRALPAGPRVAGRWDADKEAYTAHVQHLRDGGPPQPRRDSATAAAQRLNRLERAQASYAAQRAFDDPLVLAEYRLAGEAFVGTVTAAEPERVEGAGRSRKLRPHIVVSTADPVRLAPGTALVAPTRSGQKATLIAITGDGVLLELSGGMGRAATPAPGTVPEVGERICYSSLTDGYQPVADFPRREDTPWTHGGPPAGYDPAPVGDAADAAATDTVAADAAEEWS
ncbi:hypothetical protein Raf01_70480 [Rugosimonospora africana]|uniref:Uncharacterized protein n=1 Tax=Rugosimonospora africana TaxID=556532 RepID=A0A8J3R2A0_9ACTN|nr:hypothetical protein Raf01_70480 [Rugosimonospora africana]